MLRKVWCTHIHTLTHTRMQEYYTAIKREESMPFATAWIDLLGPKKSKLDCKRQTPYDCTYMWNLQNKTNKNPHSHRKLIVIIKEKGSGVG